MYALICSVSEQSAQVSNLARYATLQGLCNLSRLFSLQAISAPGKALTICDARLRAPLLPNSRVNVSLPQRLAGEQVFPVIW